MNVGLQPRFTSLLLCYFVPLRLCYFATLSLLVSHSSLQKFALFFIILYPGINLWAIYASPILAFFDFFFLFFSFPFSFFLVTLLLCCFVTLLLCYFVALLLCAFVTLRLCHFAPLFLRFTPALSLSAALKINSVEGCLCTFP